MFMKMLNKICTLKQMCTPLNFTSSSIMYTTSAWQHWCQCAIAAYLCSELSLITRVECSIVKAGASHRSNSTRPTALHTTIRQALTVDSHQTMTTPCIALNNILESPQQLLKLNATIQQFTAMTADNPGAGSTDLPSAADCCPVGQDLCLAAAA